MEVRLANQNDIYAIAKIEEICFPLSEAATYQQFLERFESFGDCFLVVEDSGKMIGFINGCVTDKPSLPDELYHDVSMHQKDGDYQTVFGLDVLPEFRHQGVAGLLLQSFIDLAKQRGKKGMILTCKDHLIHYYEKFGFVHQGVSDSQHGGSSWNDMLYIFNEGE